MQLTIIRSSSHIYTTTLCTFLSLANAITIRTYVTSTVLVTETTTTKIVCGVLVNVTGACRRRRDFQFERPEILTFDDDIDEAVDLALDTSYHNPFTPSKTLSLEITPLVVLPSQFTSPLPSNQVVRSSIVYSRPRVPNQNETKMRIFFSALNGFPRLPTETFTTTTTEKMTLAKTTVVSFFIAVCTPSPFPFKVC